MKKTTNHFNSFVVDENEFIDSQFIDTSRITHSHNYQNDHIVSKLQTKNQKLRQEVERVKSVIENQSNHSKTRYGTKLPELSKQATTQQLQNAYKQIKTYQYQISKKQKIDNEGPYVQQVRKIEKILKQKQQVSQKLRKQIAEITKQSLQYTKMLKDDYLKNQYESKAQTLHKQIKWLRQKVLQIENKLTISNNNKEKQKAFIEKLQKQLVKSGYEQRSIYNLRNKYINLKNQESYNKDNQKEMEVEVIQDRTPQAYQTLLNQIKLLKKVQKDHENQIKIIDKDKEQATQKNLQSRNRLLQIQHNIEKLVLEINQMKKMINPQNLIPQRAISQKVNLKEQLSAAKKEKEDINHIFKFHQIGKTSRTGKRFTDRTMIGKKSAYIIGISFYQKPNQTNHLLGFQAYYLVEGFTKKGLLNYIQNKRVKNPTPKLIKLQSGDYFKTIECVSNEYKVIGMSLVSRNGTVAKGGNFTGGVRKNIQIMPDEYPTCLFGSLCDGYIEMLGSEILQQ